MSDNENKKVDVRSALAVALGASLLTWTGLQLIKPSTNSVRLDEIKESVAPLQELPAKFATIESQVASISKSIEKITGKNNKIINYIMKKAIDEGDPQALDILSKTTTQTTSSAVDDITKELYASAFVKLESAIKDGDDAAVHALNIAVLKLNNKIEDGTLSLDDASRMTLESNVVFFEQDEAHLKSIFNDW